MKNLIIFPNQSPATPDKEQIRFYFEGLLAQVKLANPDAVNNTGALIGGILSLLCMYYDVQAVHDAIKQIANRSGFWKEQADLKRLSIP